MLDKTTNERTNERTYERRKELFMLSASAICSVGAAISLYYYAVHTHTHRSHQASPFSFLCVTTAHTRKKSCSFSHKNETHTRCGFGGMRQLPASFQQQQQQQHQPTEAAAAEKKALRGRKKMSENNKTYNQNSKKRSMNERTRDDEGGWGRKQASKQAS